MFMLWNSLTCEQFKNIEMINIKYIERILIIKELKNKPQTSNDYDTPGTRVGPGGRDWTLAGKLLNDCYVFILHKSSSGV